MLKSRFFMSVALVSIALVLVVLVLVAVVLAVVVLILLGCNYHTKGTHRTVTHWGFF